jgi:hypothetical protein
LHCLLLLMCWRSRCSERALLLRLLLQSLRCYMSRWSFLQVLLLSQAPL